LVFDTRGLLAVIIPFRLLDGIPAYSGLILVLPFSLGSMFYMCCFARSFTFPGTYSVYLPLTDLLRCPPHNIPRRPKKISLSLSLLSSFWIRSASYILIVDPVTCVTSLFPSFTAHFHIPPFASCAVLRVTPPRPKMKGKENVITLPLAIYETSEDIVVTSMWNNGGEASR